MEEGFHDGRDPLQGMEHRQGFYGTADLELESSPGKAVNDMPWL